ncbi:hypothetical protein [Parapedobacter koreensis]|uniref:Uncharacterized protein n=1 Tax=Parapedobacter koreensis TaxID=332977 RepID=A0A1H7FJN1_9SPHI|nr:hypothetical protein [Parapedobacter koreensis]SEK23515.1 hypothetical protein SAMN05421740_101298 [Parapedobacter koreensis]
MAKNRKKREWDNDATERLARGIAKSVNSVQAKLSDRLNRAFAKLDRRAQVTAFAVAIIAMAAYSIYLILDNLL